MAPKKSRGESKAKPSMKSTPSRPETDEGVLLTVDATALDASDPANIELVFGFVGPTGIDLDTVCDALKSQLKTMHYETIVVRLSNLITAYLGKSHDFSNQHERLETLMERGTRLREETSQADIVARLAIAAIRAERVQKTGNVLKPASRVAYLVRSFKRPEEIELFRQVYGKAFTLISVYASRAWRTQFLKKTIAPSLGKAKARSEELAIQLITRDHDEEGRKLGQKVGKTFPLADFFITCESRPDIELNLKRLVQLTYGNPYISPTRDEQAMFFAKAAALRSLDLSRQVGAAIISTDGDIMATGCNEVPKFGGGLYWGEDELPERDYERGIDSNVVIKKEIVEDVFDRLKREKLLNAKARKHSVAELTRDALFQNTAFLKDSLLFDVIEFGRAVHAEMAAITHAARHGVSLQDTRLFCTTFPCHICARHIVAAGVREVVFVEPYEKSRASELYGDSISIEPTEPSPSRTNFRAFVGVAPRRYIDFFEAQNARKTDEGKLIELGGIAATPRIKRFVFTYTFAEAFAVEATCPPPLSNKARSIP